MKKNIVFFFTDQQRADTLCPEVMPNLCALAQEGVTFSRNYTCQPVCGPARACLQTGLYATQTGCFRNAIAIPEDTRTLAHYFNDAGYQTAYVGKWHLASDSIPGIGVHCEKTAVPPARQGGYSYWRAADVLEFTSHGYDGYVFDEKGNKLDFKGYRADRITDYALEFIENRDEEKPFFLFLSHIEPHHQNDHGRFEGYKPTVDSFRDYPVPPDLSFLKGDYREQLPDYLSAVNRLDHNLGRIVSLLKEKGIYEDTVIIFTSDHGCHFKTRNFEYKRCCHDNTTRTPLVIRGPGFPAGELYTQLSGLIDLPPTMLAAADIPVPEHYMGFDLAKQVNGEIPARDAVFMQISESQCGRAVVAGQYKYSVRADSPTGYLLSSSPVYREDYLYDLENDPYEMHNLIRDKSYAQVRARMRSVLLREMAAAGESKPKILCAHYARKK